VTGCRQDVCAGGSTATATGGSGGGGLALLDGALLGKDVKVATDGSRREAKTGGDSPRRQRPVLGDRLPDPVPGARVENVRCGVNPVRTVRCVLVSDKHNNSVT
jgi:hypothetical protein